MTQPPSVDRLALLYRVSQVFTSSLNLDEVLRRVMDEVITVTRAERGFLMLRDADDQLAFRAARGMDQQTIGGPEFQISRSVVEDVAQEGKPRLTNDAQSDAWLQKRQSVVGLRLRSILCVPLQIKGATIGVIYVDNRLQAGIFTKDDLELLTSIAASAAVAIENARLYQVAVDKGRLERELQVAREVQASLLPRTTPRLAGWEFAARWQPAREVAGDFYDFIPGPHGHVGLVIADVTDKGMPAALFMANTRSLIRASVTNPFQPADNFTQANQLICADASHGMFVTACYAQIAADSSAITYVNAGHNPPLVCRPAQGEVAKFARTGLPLGVDASLKYGQHTIGLRPGDFVLFYTDGITDALNVRGEEFGEARLRQVLLTHRQAPVDTIATAVVEAVSAFTGTGAPFDDITLVVAKRV